MTFGVGVFVSAPLTATVHSAQSIAQASSQTMLRWARVKEPLTVPFSDSTSGTISTTSWTRLFA